MKRKCRAMFNRGNLNAHLVEFTVFRMSRLTGNCRYYRHKFPHNDMSLIYRLTGIALNVNIYIFVYGHD